MGVSRRVRSWKRASLITATVATLCAGVIAATALWDHTHPGNDSHRLWVADWNCQVMKRDCDMPKPWHAGWHRREPVYHAAFAAASAIGLASAAAWYLLGRRKNDQIK